MNAELCQLLVYLEAPSIAGKALKMIAEAPTQEEQMEYARALRVLKTGWTMSQRKEYFTWILKAANFKGGNSLAGRSEMGPVRIASRIGDVRESRTIVLARFVTNSGFKSTLLV